MSVVEKEAAARKVEAARLVVADLEAQVDRAFDVKDTAAMVAAYRNVREARTALQAVEVELARVSQARDS